MNRSTHVGILSLLHFIPHAIDFLSQFDTLIWTFIKFTFKSKRLHRSVTSTRKRRTNQANNRVSHFFSPDSTLTQEDWASPTLVYVCKWIHCLFCYRQMSGFICETFSTFRFIFVPHQTKQTVKKQENIIKGKRSTRWKRIKEYKNRNDT